jgi:enoyl-CoA hydratase/carnithine racemase
LWLTFNRPHKANALSLPLLAGLAMSLGEASTRNDVKAVVLTGVGERTFSAGADLSRPLTMRMPTSRSGARNSPRHCSPARFFQAARSAVNGARSGSGHDDPSLV